MNIMEDKSVKNHEDAFESIKNKMNNFYHKTENSDNFFSAIKEYIISKIDIDLTSYRQNFLQRRLYHRLLRLDISSYAEYLNYLKKNPNEVKEFILSFTIHVTEFFRDISPFRFLEKELIPKIAKLKQASQDKTIRILSAPCSTGEEPYSIAIIADFLLKNHNIKNPIEIYAFDIDENVVDFASRGIYPKETIRNISPYSLNHNFTEYNKNFYQIKPQLKNYITFFTQDLLKPLSTNKYDLICCRNFLIYISKNNQQVIINNLIQEMASNAYLMLGKTEGFPLLNSKIFKAVSLREHIYQYSPIF